MLKKLQILDNFHPTLKKNFLARKTILAIANTI